MSDLLDVKKLKLAEDLEFKSPVPTQMISNGEFTPMPQTKQQKQVEERIKQLAELAAREFLRCSSTSTANDFAAFEYILTIEQITGVTQLRLHK